MLVKIGKQSVSVVSLATVMVVAVVAVPVIVPPKTVIPPVVTLIPFLAVIKPTESIFVTVSYTHLTLPTSG